MSKQTTIIHPVSLSGKGLHTGKHVTLTFSPAPANHGVVFRRIDLPGQPTVKALGIHVFDTSRGTSIRDGAAEVRTIEHLMAALAGLQIDNVLVEIDAEETPILDGSSRLYVEALQKAEIQTLTEEREYFTISQTVTYNLPEKGIEIRMEPADDFQAFVHVDYGTQILAQQEAELRNITDFYPSIYNCRTFVFLHELQFLIQHNLVRGGDVDNAIVFVAQMPDEKALQQLADFFHKSDLKVTENGILNNVELHHDNEPARHKLLDLVGDLYLLGKPVKGHVFASRPGHFANTEFVKQLIQKA
ncbi:MAG: UDP-3-O-acyl-N-acetylglucosamine deacetylase [Bacteroidales bacterium]|nr:UDP-3-O-acyl-N-acetylglucosamine deacetylase [Bacteroidales bacterium]